MELIDVVNNSVVTSWSVTNAWPKALKGINNGSDGKDPYTYIETIILAHEGVAEKPSRTYNDQTHPAQTLTLLNKVHLP